MRYLILLLLSAAAWAQQPTLRVAYANSFGVNFQLVTLNTSKKTVEAFGSGGGGSLEIYREGKLVAKLESPAARDGARRQVKPGEPIYEQRFQWEEGPRAPAGSYVARVVKGPEVAFKLPLPMAERIFLDDHQNVIYELRNLTQKPVTLDAKSGGFGGILKIYRGDRLVDTLTEMTNFPKKVVPPGGVMGQVRFPWKGQPGTYRARLNSLELTFTLPRKP